MKKRGLTVLLMVVFALTSVFTTNTVADEAETAQAIEEMIASAQTKSGVTFTEAQKQELRELPDQVLATVDNPKELSEQQIRTKINDAATKWVLKSFPFFSKEQGQLIGISESMTDQMVAVAQDVITDMPDPEPVQVAEADAATAEIEEVEYGTMTITVKSEKDKRKERKDARKQARKDRKQARQEAAKTARASSSESSFYIDSVLEDDISAQEEDVVVAKEEENAPVVSARACTPSIIEDTVVAVAEDAAIEVVEPTKPKKKYIYPSDCIANPFMQDKGGYCGRYIADCQKDPSKRIGLGTCSALESKCASSDELGCVMYRKNPMELYSKSDEIYAAMAENGILPAPEAAVAETPADNEASTASTEDTKDARLEPASCASNPRTAGCTDTMRGCFSAPTTPDQCTGLRDSCKANAGQAGCQAIKQEAKTKSQEEFLKLKEEHPELDFSDRVTMVMDDPKAKAGAERMKEYGLSNDKEMECWIVSWEYDQDDSTCSTK
ncbi:MAG: hypothetical protein ABIA04_08675 [Pseudomonadota bacterium]